MNQEAGLPALLRRIGDAHLDVNPMDALNAWMPATALPAALWRV